MYVTTSKAVTKKTKLSLNAQSEISYARKKLSCGLKWDQINSDLIGQLK